MARGSIEKYEGRRGVSWRLRIVTGYDERDYPIVRRHTVKGTKREAETKLRELLSEVDKGSYVEPSKMTLEELINQWFETHRQGIALTTERRYRSDIDTHIIPLLGKVHLQKMTTMQVQGFVNHLLKNGFQGTGSRSGLSSKSVRDCLGLLRRVMEQAVEWGLINRNPTKGVMIPTVVHKEPRVITESQAEMLISALHGTDAWLPTVIAYHTGMRRGEILALSWDCVDLDKKTIEVRRSYSLYDEKGPIFKEPKTRSGRRKVEIGSTLIKVLKLQYKQQAEARLKLGDKWGNEHNLVCISENGRYISTKRFSWLFSDRAKKLNLDLTFHGLRHTHVSMLIKAGVPINVISARIGHSSPSITHDVYAHLLPGMGRDAVDRFEHMLAESLTMA